MKSLFPDPDFHDLYGFHRLHKAAVGLPGYRMENELSNSVQCYDIDIADRYGWTPLFWAVSRDDFEAAEMLISRGADCNRLNDLEHPPLTYAVMASKRCVDLLLAAKADFGALGKLRTTPLHYVAFSNPGTEALEIIESLVTTGIDLDAQDVSGDTALNTALEMNQPDIANYLIEKGANIKIRNNQGDNALCWATISNCHSTIELLLDRGEDHTTSIERCGTFMHLVAECADLETLRLLAGSLKCRDINNKNRLGLSPLQIALQREDVDAEWRDAFADFLKAIDQQRPFGDHFFVRKENIEQCLDYESDAEDSGVEFEDAVEVQW